MKRFDVYIYLRGESGSHVCSMTWDFFQDFLCRHPEVFDDGFWFASDTCWFFSHKGQRDEREIH